MVAAADIRTRLTHVTDGLFPLEGNPVKRNIKMHTNVNDVKHDTNTNPNLQVFLGSQAPAKANRHYINHLMSHEVQLYN